MDLSRFGLVLGLFFLLLLKSRRKKRPRPRPKRPWFDTKTYTRAM